MSPIEVKLTIELGDRAFRLLGLFASAFNDLVKKQLPAAEPSSQPSGIVNATFVAEALKSSELREVEEEEADGGEPAPAPVETPAEVVAESAPIAIALPEAAALPFVDPNLAQRRSTKAWTPARIQLMTDMRVSRTPFADIRAAVNRLPGSLIASDSAVEKSYYKLRAARMLPQPTVKPEKITAVHKPAAPAITAPAERAIVRPPPVMPARPAVTDIPTRRDPPAHLAGAGQKVCVPLSHARQWAAERGLCNGGSKLDLPMVNKKRRDLGLQEFELDGTRA